MVYHSRMTPTDEIFAGTVGIILFAVLAVLAITICILWILLPFAVFGLRPRLDKLIAQDATNARLALDQARANTDLLKAIHTEAQRTNAILAAVHNVEEG